MFIATDAGSWMTSSLLRIKLSFSSSHSWDYKYQQHICFVKNFAHVSVFLPCRLCIFLENGMLFPAAILFAPFLKVLLTLVHMPGSPSSEFSVQSTSLLKAATSYKTLNASFPFRKNEQNSTMLTSKMLAFEHVYPPLHQKLYYRIEIPFGIRLFRYRHFAIYHHAAHLYPL